MKFRAPPMSYVPRQLEAWEKTIAFTVVPQTFDAIYPAVAGVVRHREGPLSEGRDERRPPLMVQAGTPGQMFNGTLVFSPKEAPGLTVIEHPLDEVGPEDFPTSLTKVLPEVELVTFWSNLDTTIRQEHGYKVTLGGKPMRYVRLTRGYESGHWEWEAEGAVMAFEDKDRLAEKRLWRRLDRPLIFALAGKLGLVPDASLFGRDFAASSLLSPLPYETPEAVSDMTSDHGDAAERAAMAGVRQLAPEMSDAEFAETARAMRSMSYWDRELSVIARKAWESSGRAKSAKGRERAQWRVVEGLTKWKADMEAIDMINGLGLMAKMQFDEPMKALGRDTEAYRAYRALFPRIWPLWR